MALPNEFDRIKAIPAMSMIEIIGLVLFAMMTALFLIPLIILTCCLL